MSARSLYVLVGTVTVLALVAAAAISAPHTRVDHVALYQEGIGIEPDGTLATIPAGQPPRYLSGTRVLDPRPSATPEAVLAAEELADETRAWLRAGSVPGTGGPHGDLADDALLDLHALISGGGGAIAGSMPRWRYVWPRDAAFVVAALTVTGHRTDAVGILAFLQDVQAEDGSFHARYTVAEGLPPDDRGLQTDGTGWAVWALEQVVLDAGRSPAAQIEQQALLHQFAPLLERSTTFLLDQVSGSDPLPPASSDYWEHSEQQVTLGTAAPVLAGLEAAARLHQFTGNSERPHQLTAAAEALRAAIEERFGPSGYGRYPGRHARDAATAFLLPPFLEEPLPGAREAWRASISEMARPAGGLAPGASWPETSLSWTPQTTLYAWTAATLGERQLAEQYLTWVDDHRTASGAIPEKVGPDGAPAAVAPLAWSCALVLLTLATLEEQGT
ncbi:glycoside hydrolase family 15 [Ruania halotolerans]|uniref:glycoside hydrolase family 15 n=1 Tax=Ruania halotolerans TaxID=2897773 RepID=UPI001E2B97CF|nr:glycoside hydrolase family 15 [Ruania halotolerans]UFU07217.1 glycoside hydrolase family 15 [Ruania halotolerans]